MDQQRDYLRFQKLIGRLCETLGKPMTDELIESWWKALRHVDFDDCAERVEAFLVRADEATKFPRPAQMRAKNDVPLTGADANRNPIRDYWRSCIVNAVAREMGHTTETLEPFVEANAGTFGRSMLELLNELDSQERRDGRTHGMHLGCYRRCNEIARSYPELVRQ